MSLPMRMLLAIALSFVVACGPEEADIARTTFERSIDPIGDLPNALDNALHAAHLSGTTPIGCNQCHNVEASEFEIPPRERCLSCHRERYVALHREEVECIECHAFSAGDTTDKIDCLRCHKEMQGKHKAIDAHTKIDCRHCHRLHDDPPLAIETCLTCHEDHQQGHGKPELTTIARCSECHLPHTKSIKAVALCESCHQEKLVRAVFRGHNKCNTCHKIDSQTPPEKAVACQSCHKNRLTLAENRVSKHAQCEHCHSPHDPRGTAIQSCRRCHSKVATKHPAKKRSGRCVGCHQAHPRSAMTGATACSKCHDKARADDSWHAPKRITCLQCHGAHDFKSATCESCHQDQARLTSSTREHDKCEGCHKTSHAPKAAPESCTGCHMTEYNTAPSKHRECKACHEPHSGRHLPSARCESCHKDIPDTMHGLIDGGCKNCHRPHGPGGHAKPPGCTSCHAPKELPALHAVDEHRECLSCHKGHSLRKSTRETCLAKCHEKHIDHEPVAKICTGCHPFGASK